MTNHDRSTGSPSVRVRQVALCTDDIWREEQRIVAELGVAAVHRDPPNVFEMRNAVFAVGDTFLEVLQPETDNAPSARFLDRRGGPGGYMLIMQTDDLTATRERVDAMGIRIVFDQPAADAHGVEASALHLHPADTGGAIMSFDQMDPSDGWAWAGRSWRGHVHTDTVESIVGVELSSSDPDALAARFGRLVDRPVDDERTVALDDSTVRIVAGPDDQPDRLSAVEMRAADRARAGSMTVIGGTEIRFV
ncbi:MAG: VOC family protein [Ilumatobacteraceae bacterium]